MGFCSLTQPNPIKPNQTQHNLTQLNPIKPNSTQPNPTQLNPIKPNLTQPNPRICNKSNDVVTSCSRLTIEISAGKSPK